MVGRVIIPISKQAQALVTNTQGGKSRAWVGFSTLLLRLKAQLGQGKEATEEKKQKQHGPALAGLHATKLNCTKPALAGIPRRRKNN